MKPIIQHNCFFLCCQGKKKLNNIYYFLQNDDHPLCYPVYNLCFANFLLGRYPHGPGQFIFGTFEGVTKYSSMFPVDYSALNSPPEKLEQYSPHKKSNRHSVVV